VLGPQQKQLKANGPGQSGTGNCRNFLGKYSGDPGPGYAPNCSCITRPIASPKSVMTGLFGTEMLAAIGDIVKLIEEWEQNKIAEA